MEITEIIIVGIVTGILTTGVLFLGNKLVQNSFIPWYRSIMYKGISISGQWFSYSLLLQKVVVELQQNCERIFGKATYILDTETDEAVDTIRTFDVQGDVINRFVTLNLSHTDPSRLGKVSFLLEVIGDGTILKGVSTAYSINDSSIGATNFIFYREESKAQATRKSIKELLAKRDIQISRLVESRNFFVLPKDIEEKLAEKAENEDGEVKESDANK